MIDLSLLAAESNSISVSRTNRKALMPANMMGTEMDWTAQTVSLFAEQCSIPSSAFVERIALALMKLLIVISFVPVSKPALDLANVGSARTTLRTMPTLMLPSLLSSGWGRGGLLIGGGAG